MSKKNRAKSKAKRFGEGSAKPIVSAATYGVGGNAFAQAIADPVSTVHSNKPELLVVDGVHFDAVVAFSGVDGARMVADAIDEGCTVLLSQPQEDEAVHTDPVAALADPDLPAFVRSAGFRPITLSGGRLQ